MTTMTTPATGGAVRPLKGLAMVALSDVHPSPNNPRERLTDIDELASSIRGVGLIQPLIVQKVPGKDGFQIVAGHRRHAAAGRAGMAEVPCVVRRDMLPDEELLAMLVENGQRAGLDPIEEARALAKLKAGGLSDAEIGRKIGRPQNFVGRRLVLLSLPIEDQEQIRTGAVGVTTSVEKAMVDSGRARPQARGKKSEQRGRCVLCDTAHDADRGDQ